MLKRHFDNFVTKLIDWWFRVPTVERFLVGAGVALLIAIYGGVPLIIELLRLTLGAVPNSAVRAKEAIETIDVTIIGVSVLLIVAGLAFATARFVGEARTRSKKRSVVIEARGLRDDDGNALADTIAKHHNGSVTPILLDLRNRLDGKVIEPERALDEISTMHRSLQQNRRDGDRADVMTFYGGLTSVPYTFLTGVLIDDESTVVTYDWDRAQEAWRQLDADDDNTHFEVSGLDGISMVAEVVVALSFSYPVQEADLSTTFAMPTIRLTLSGMSSDSHWSQRKQNRLAQEFFEVAKQLSAKGVQRIHLVLAAPNSVVFTFGRRYDKRNLPEVVVYQYQRGENPAYPWGVLMPIAGEARARVLYTVATTDRSN